MEDKEYEMKARSREVLLGTLFCLVLASAAVSAERTHAPKGVWVGMMANLSEVQGIASAVMVYDMKRATDLAKQLADRQRYVASLDSVKGDWKKSYEELAKVADELHAAAAAGDDQQTLVKLGEVLTSCNSCHYDLRDKKRREEKK
jgi:cytochrome c556